MADPLRIGTDEFVTYFREQEDPRPGLNRKHPPASVLALALNAVLAGASEPTAIARWAAL